jgi:hypothetical protein
MLANVNRKIYDRSSQEMPQSSALPANSDAIWSIHFKSAVMAGSTSRPKNHDAMSSNETLQSHRSSACCDYDPSKHVQSDERTESMNLTEKMEVYQQQQHDQLSILDFKIIKVLGQGSNVIIYLAEDYNGNRVAIRKIPKMRGDSHQCQYLQIKT